MEGVVNTDIIIVCIAVSIIAIIISIFNIIYGHFKFIDNNDNSNIEFDKDKIIKESLKNDKLNNKFIEDVRKLFNNGLFNSYSIYIPKQKENVAKKIATRGAKHCKKPSKRIINRISGKF